MNDSVKSSGFATNSADGGDAPAGDVPQFGAVDIVEAFTAMRHEWRGQTKESRALAEQIQAAVAGIQALEARMLECAAEPESGSNDVDPAAVARPLAMLIIETDHQLSRAVSAIAQLETTRQQQAESDLKTMENCFAGLNRLARWLARPLMTVIAEQRRVPVASGRNPAVEGLTLVLARLRREMQEQGIERIEALGKIFDAETMRAIGNVESSDYPSGHVAEQYSPAYRWQGRLVRFADVIVSG